MRENLTVINQESVFVLKSLDPKISNDIESVKKAYGDYFMTDAERSEHDKRALPKASLALQTISNEALLCFLSGYGSVPESISNNELIKKELDRRVSEAASGNKEILKGKHFETLLYFASNSNISSGPFYQATKTARENNLYIRDNQGINPDKISVVEFNSSVNLSDEQKKAFDAYKSFGSQTTQKMSEVAFDTTVTNGGIGFYIFSEMGPGDCVDAMANGTYSDKLEGFLKKVESDTLTEGTGAECLKMFTKEQLRKVILTDIAEEKTYQKSKDKIEGNNDDEKRKKFSSDRKKLVDAYLKANNVDTKSLRAEQYGDVLNSAVKWYRKEAEARNNRGDNNMTDKFDPTKRPEYQAVVDFYKTKGVNIDWSTATEESFTKLVEDMKKESGQEQENASEGSNPEENQGDNTGAENSGNDGEDTVGLDGKKKEDAEWVKDLNEHWQTWCKDNNYVYERNEVEKGFGFKYYKTEKDKETGDHAVEVHYESQESVKIRTKDGKAADYDFWKNFALGAKKDEQTVNFAKMKDEENKARLYTACILNGIETNNIDPTTLNFEETFKQLSEADRKIAAEKLGVELDGKKKTTENTNEQINVSIPKEKVAELRELSKRVAEARGKLENGEALDEETSKIIAGLDKKERARKIMKENRDIAGDATKTTEEQDIAKGRYNKIKQELIKNALKERQ